MLCMVVTVPEAGGISVPLLSYRVSTVYINFNLLNPSAIPNSDIIRLKPVKG